MFDARNAPLARRPARRRPHGWLALLCLALLLAACQAAPPSTSGPTPAEAPRPASAAQPQPLRLALLHTNDTWGYFWPCG